MIQEYSHPAALGSIPECYFCLYLVVFDRVTITDDTLCWAYPRTITNRNQWVSRG